MYSTFLWWWWFCCWWDWINRRSCWWCWWCSCRLLLTAYFYIFFTRCFSVVYFNMNRISFKNFFQKVWNPTLSYNNIVSKINPIQGSPIDTKDFFCWSFQNPRRAILKSYHSQSNNIFFSNCVKLCISPTWIPTQW